MERFAVRVTGQKFQSSPGPKAGCYLWIVQAILLDNLFQSSPGPKAGCYGVIVRLMYYTFGVSILTRPESRMLRRRGAQYRQNPTEVSILTRPESRMLPEEDRRQVEDILFQSSPGPKAGCYHTSLRSQHRSPLWFQSSPGPKAGCYGK